MLSVGDMTEGRYVFKGLEMAEELWNCEVEETDVRNSYWLNIFLEPLCLRKFFENSLED